MSMPRNEGILCCTRGCQIVAHQPVNWSGVVFPGALPSIVHKLVWCMDSRVWVRIQIDLGANNQYLGYKHA